VDKVIFLFKQSDILPELSAFQFFVSFAKKYFLDKTVSE